MPAAQRKITSLSNKIDLNDVSNDGFWLTKEHREIVATKLKDQPDGRYSKDFFTYDVRPVEEKIQENVLYIDRKIDGSFEYTCITPTGEQVTQSISKKDLEESLKDPSVMLKQKDSDAFLYYQKFMNQPGITADQKKAVKFEDLFQKEEWQKNLRDWKPLLLDIATKRGDIPPKMPLGIIKSEGHHYAVYHGVQRDKALGAGSFGKAKLIQDLDTRWEGVLKVLSEESKEEYGILKKLRLAHGEHFYREKDYDDDKEKSYHIIMDKAEGQDLHTLLKDPTFAKLSPIQQLDAALAVLTAVDTFNNPPPLGSTTPEKYVHCDIKPANILYNPTTNKATLIDFGTVGIKDNKGNAAGEYKGSPAYLPPEIKPKKKCIYNDKTDAYAAGLTLKNMLGFKVDFPTGFSQNTSFSDNKELENLLNDLTHSKASQRITTGDAIQSLQKIRTKLVDDYPVNIGTLNLKDYIAAKRRNETITLPKGINQILLIDDSGAANDSSFNKIDIAIQRDLEKDGIFIRSEVLLSPTTQQVNEFFVELAKKENIKINQVDLFAKEKAEEKTQLYTSKSVTDSSLLALTSQDTETGLASASHEAGGKQTDVLLTLEELKKIVAVSKQSPEKTSTTPDENISSSIRPRG